MDWIIWNRESDTVVEGNKLIQSIPDDNYNFPTEHHRKFHEWETKQVNEFIDKLEAQFKEVNQ
jgi:hypothetical protein